MIRAIFLFVVLGMGLFVGSQFSGQQGYVLISVANKTIEMSVTTLVVLIIALLASLFSLEFLIKKVLSASSSTWNWFSIRKLKRARRFTNEGIVKLLEGDWQGAEKKVTRWANHHDMPLLCYLIASEAAQEMGDERKRDHYLELAQQQDGSNLAVQLTKARLQVKQAEFEPALETLSSLQQAHGNNQMLLNLLKTTYLNLQLWQPLLTLIPKLSKQKLIDEEEKAGLMHDAHCGMLHDVAKTKGTEGVLSYWAALARKQRQDRGLIACLTMLLIERQADSQAYGLVKEALKKQADEQLIALIPKMNLADIHPATQLLEGMLKKDSQNVAILSALAQLCFRAQQWPQAQQHLEHVLSIRANVADYSLLADALEKQNLTQAANDVSRKALTLVDATA
jgi:HemY protein